MLLVNACFLIIKRMLIKRILNINQLIIIFIKYFLFWNKQLTYIYIFKMHLISVCYNIRNYSFSNNINIIYINNIINNYINN